MASPPPRLILASASPRRHELLTALGLAFEVRPADVDERTEERDPVRLAEGLALRKARALVERSKEFATTAILGADTIVVLEGRPLGKPAGPEEAREMLEALRGRTHEVVTGLAVIAGERVAADHARTAVTMRDYGSEEVERYIATGSPFDKAGAYAIQDGEFAPVERYEGCECSVIGLPLWTARRLLRVTAGLMGDEPAYDRCRECPLREVQS